MDNGHVTHIVRMDPEGTTDAERAQLAADFAALLASGQPLLGGTPLMREPVLPDVRDPAGRAGLRPIAGGKSPRLRRPSEA